MNEKMLRLLLEHGATVDSSLEQGQLKRLGPDERESLKILELLIERGMNLSGDLGGRLLHLVTSDGISEILRLLLSHGVNVNWQEPSKGQTALHIAAYYEYTEAVSILLERHANSNAHTFVRLVPLHCSAKPEHHFDSASNAQIITKKLMEHGASPNARDDKGITPLQLALGGDQLGVAEALIEGGVDVNAKLVHPDGGDTAALHVASMDNTDTSSSAFRYCSPAKEQMSMRETLCRKRQASRKP